VTKFNLRKTQTPLLRFVVDLLQETRNRSKWAECGLNGRECNSPSRP